jgi:hypothetical protein
LGAKAEIFPYYDVLCAQVATQYLLVEHRGAQRAKLLGKGLCEQVVDAEFPAGAFFLGAGEKLIALLRALDGLAEVAKKNRGARVKGEKYSGKVSILIACQQSDNMAMSEMNAVKIADGNSGIGEKGRDSSKFS